MHRHKDLRGIVFACGRHQAIVSLNVSFTMRRRRHNKFCVFAQFAVLMSALLSNLIANGLAYISSNLLPFCGVGFLPSKSLLRIYQVGMSCSVHGTGKNALSMRARDYERKRDTCSHWPQRSAIISRILVSPAPPRDVAQYGLACPQHARLPRVRAVRAQSEHPPTNQTNYERVVCTWSLRPHAPQYQKNIYNNANSDKTVSAWSGDGHERVDACFWSQSNLSLGPKVYNV